MRKIHKRLVAALAGFFCLTTIGTSMASYTNRIAITNPFTTAGPSSAVLVENFSPVSTFLPGETVVKQPYFKNTGEADLLIRVKVTAEWKDSDGKTFKSGDAFGDEDMVTKMWTTSWKNDWKQIGDFYYYNQILGKAGGQSDTTSVILEKLQLSTEVSNDSHEEDYSDKSYVLDFEAEAVPADRLSVEEWKKDIGDSLEGLSWKELLK